MLARRVTARHGHSGQAQVMHQTMQPRHRLLMEYLVPNTDKKQACSALKTIKTKQSGNFLLTLKTSQWF